MTQHQAELDPMANHVSKKEGSLYSRTDSMIYAAILYVEDADCWKE